MRYLTAIFAFCCSVVASESSRAQTLRGRVTDAATGSPVAAASLSLLGRDSAVVATAVADDSGQYVVRAQRSGEYRLKLERIGYASRITEPMKLSEGSIYTLPLELTPAAVPIAPVTVKVEPRVTALERNGYYDRKKLGLGRFVDRTLIENRPGSPTSELFRGMPGVRLVPKSNTRGSQVFFRGGSGFRVNCPPRVFVDGVPANAEGQSYDFELNHISDIEAIEVYTGPSQVPPQYGGANSACGVVLIWRRVGG